MYLMQGNKTMRSAILIFYATLAAWISGSNAFAFQKHGRVRTGLFDNTKGAPTLPSSLAKVKSYGEESRQYRRTVYSHDDWRKHRSPDRFLYYIGTIFTSGIYKK
jgi:hypothetical protein